MSSNLAEGWLTDQLPRALATDEFVRRFVALFEEPATDLQLRIDALGELLDPAMAPSDHLPWLASWLGRHLDGAVPVAQQRVVVSQAGPSLPWRGTTRGLRILVESYTGAPAEVTDSGGVHLRGEWAPTAPVVRVAVPHTGGLDRSSLEELIRRDLPVGAALELHVGPDAEPDPGEPAPAEVHAAGAGLVLIELQVVPSTGVLRPGEGMSCQVTVRNLDDRPHHFRLVVLGVPADWWEAPAGDLAVGPGTGVGVRVLFGVPGYVDPAQTPTISFDVGVRGSGGSALATVRVALEGT
jgi:phage tail-like protein